MLLKNLSTPISLTRLHSQRACQLAQYAFSSLGTTSAGLGSNEKKKKATKQIYQRKFILKGERAVTNNLYPKHKAQKDLYWRKKRKIKKNHIENCSLLKEKKIPVSSSEIKLLRIYHHTHKKIIDKLRSIPNSCQDCLSANCRRQQSECTARMKCFTGARMEAQQAPKKHRYTRDHQL